MKVTLITIFSGETPTLQDTFQSVLQQTYPDIEYLVIAHEPTENACNLLCEYEEQFNGAMRYISPISPDVCYTINLGLAKARGEIIGFLPPNAVYSYPTIVEDIVREMEATAVSAIYGDYCLAKGDKRIYKSYNFFGRLLLRFGVMPPLSVFYCKTEVYHEYGMFNITYRSAIIFECLLRLIYVHRVRTLFLPMDIVTIYTDRAEVKTKGRTIDKLHALKKYNICSNRFLVWVGKWL